MSRILVANPVALRELMKLYSEKIYASVITDRGFDRRGLRQLDLCSLMFTESNFEVRIFPTLRAQRLRGEPFKSLKIPDKRGQQ
jgi:hypothetical protein